MDLPFLVNHRHDGCFNLDTPMDSPLFGVPTQPEGRLTNVLRAWLQSCKFDFRAPAVAISCSRRQCLDEHNWSNAPSYGVHLGVAATVHLT
jgi:hypothetical protein